MLNYDAIKALAVRKGVKVTDLIALSRNHDPFFVGTQAQKVNAQWFAKLWQEFGFVDGIHLRRVHYRIVSSKTPIMLPSRKPYENTLSAWDFLNEASAAARYLGLVDFSAFVDRRNPDAVIFSAAEPSEPEISVDDQSFVLQSLPHFPELPEYSISNYQDQQRFVLELWCEKSTMNDVLEPICQRYRCNFQSGVGELSTIKVHELFERIRLAGRPTRIGYLSDFDPAGQSMPVAVSRKLEWFLRNHNGSPHDVKIFPIALSLDQVRQYRLPRTPIKDTELRKEGFEERFGEGATELDALEAIAPGTLEEIVCEFINRFYDHGLEDRVDSARECLAIDLAEIRQAVIREHTDEIEQLRREHRALQQEFSRKLKLHSQKLNALLESIGDELLVNAPDLTPYPIPEPVEGDESVEPLFDSSRDYFEQLAVYKKFQGRDVVAINDDDVRSS